MSIAYLAILDYEHLDNGLFLKTFANAISRHSPDQRGLILHADSRYTDRIIQTGVMRDDARKRAIKDLNNRLIALFADEGVSAIGLNGYQRELISARNGTISVDVQQINKLPHQPALLLSSLIHSYDSGQPQSAPLSDVAICLQNSLEIEHTFIFARSDDAEIIKKNFPETIEKVDDRASFIKENVPEEFHENRISAKLVPANDFRNFPDLKNFTQL